MFHEYMTGFPQSPVEAAVELAGGQKYWGSRREAAELLRMARDIDKAEALRLWRVKTYYASSDDIPF